MNLAAMKTVGVFAALGAIIGDVIASLVAPRFLTWYNTPGAGAIQTICDMKTMSETIFSQLIQAQLIGAITGAVVLAVAGGLIARRRMGRALPSA